MAKHVWRSHGVVEIVKRSGARVVPIYHMNPKAAAVQMPFIRTSASAAPQGGFAALCFRRMKSAAAAIRNIFAK